MAGRTKARLAALERQRGTPKAVIVGYEDTSTRAHVFVDGERLTKEQWRQRLADGDGVAFLVKYGDPAELIPDMEVPVSGMVQGQTAR